MTGDEARKVAWIAAQADGGCIVCVRDMAVELTIAFPDHDWAALVGYERASVDDEAFVAEVRKGGAERHAATA